MTDSLQSTAAADPRAARLIAGDEQVLAELAEQQRVVIERWLARKYKGLLRPLEADDVLQESLLRLWGARSAVHAECESFIGYFHSIVRNVVRNWLKTRCHHLCRAEAGVDPGRLARHTETTPVQTARAGADDTTDTPLPAGVQQAWDRLSEVQRRILWADACAPDGTAVTAALAKELDVTASRIRTERCRGLRKLRRQLPPPQTGGSSRTEKSEALWCIL